MATLHELTRPDSIRLDVQAADWRAAITTAGRLLETDGVSSGHYTDAMVRNVEDNGPYIVVSPGFAFAHARPNDDVHRTGMAWIRLDEPVAFGHESNDPVTLVAALAAVDSSAHLTAMQQLAQALGDADTREALESATTPGQFHDALAAVTPKAQGSTTAAAATGATAASTQGAAGEDVSAPTHATKDHILTVCGNGLGTSLFLKNTLEKVLDQWGWGPYLTVEATDTISAKGKAKDADLIMTSGEIARTLGDPGIPVKVISNFTSTEEIDAALRDSYDV